MKKLILAAVSLLTLASTACLRAPTTGVGNNQSDVTPVFDISFNGSFVTCAAFFSVGGQPVQLESDAQVTCNRVPMAFGGSAYATSLIYYPGVDYTINVTRPSHNVTVVSPTSTF